MKRMMLAVSVLALVLSVSFFVERLSRSASCGGDLQQMTAAAFSTPDPPQNLTVVPGNRDVVLFWDAPDFDGGGIDFYSVYVNSLPQAEHQRHTGAGQQARQRTHVFVLRDGKQ